MNRDIHAICADDATDRTLIEPAANGAHHARSAMGVQPEQSRHPPLMPDLNFKRPAGRYHPL
jgi:hypothetical protein